MFVQPSMRKILTSDNYEFHTHQLAAEINLKIVIKDVPNELNEKKIAELLTEMDYPPIKVTRMLGKKDTSIQMIVVEMERKYKSLYIIKKFCDLGIVVEPLKRKADVIQCYRCQIYGHLQKNCTASPKCIKCAHDHFTYECKKERTTPAWLH